MGHCIGFRHTDYMNRSYSCRGSAVNEGSAGVGAVYIPGTPIRTKRRFMDAGLRKYFFFIQSAFYKC